MVDDFLQAVEEAAKIVDRQETPEEISFADRLRRLRSRLDLSQGAFAERFGLPLATVRNWEQGRRKNVGAAPELLISMIERDPDGMSEMVAAM